MARPISTSVRTLLIAPVPLLLVALAQFLPGQVRPSSEALDIQPSLSAAPVEQGTNPLADAERARHNGDVDRAVSLYAGLQQDVDPEVAEEAQTRLAGVLFAAGRLPEAQERAQALSAASSQKLRDRGTILLAEIARANKDCDRAEPLYQRVITAKQLLAPYAHIGLIACAESANKAEAMAQYAQAVLDADPHGRLRIEALEKLAAAELKRGNPNKYLEIYDQLYTLGTTRGYRASILSSSADVAKNIGNRDLAVQKLATLVREFPEQARSSSALDALNALQGAGNVTWTQAAMARLNSGQLQPAIDGFDQALAESPDGPEAPTARYNRAVALLRQGHELQAAQAMRANGERYPESSIAPTALLRAGRIIESNDDFDQARQIYARLAETYSTTNAGRNGRFRLGLLAWVRGDYSGAIAAWSPLADDGAERDLQSLALLWQGKAYGQLGDSAQSNAAFQKAAQVGPDAFAGFRGQGILAGDTRALHVFQSLALAPSSPEAQDPGLEEWLNSLGSSQQALRDRQAQEPMYQRALELTRLGLRDQAAWEFEGLSAQATQSQPAAPAQFLLASTQMRLGYVSPALRTAEQSARELNVPRTSLPIAFQKLIFPLGFDELLVDSANRYGADAMLFASLVRQESRFEPAARSSANALGLSQIVPGTGNSIAAAMGRGSVTEADLFKPAVNLDLGAYYLARQLERSGGLILPALSAYNAGGGATDKWLNEFGRNDMELLTERIPYSETNLYLHVVYENYGMYKRLYARG